MNARVRAVLAASLVVASLAFLAPGAQAINWCPNVTVTVEPPFYTTNIPSTYTVLVVNSGSSDLNITQVAVRFSSETSDRIISTANVTISASGSESFTTPQVTLSGGSVTVTTKLDGYAVTDPADARQCTKTSSIQTIDTGGFFGAAIFAIIAFAVVVVIIVIVIVVIIVVVTRKKTPPGPPPYAPGYPPQYPQPYQPPYGPPPGQPPQGPPQQPPPTR